MNPLNTTEMLQKQMDNIKKSNNVTLPADDGRAFMQDVVASGDTLKKLNYYAAKSANGAIEMLGVKKRRLKEHKGISRRQMARITQKNVQYRSRSSLSTQTHGSRTTTLLYSTLTRSKRRGYHRFNDPATVRRGLARPRVQRRQNLRLMRSSSSTTDSLNLLVRMQTRSNTTSQERSNSRTSKQYRRKSQRNNFVLVVSSGSWGV